MIDLSGIFPPLPTSFGKSDELLTSKMQENIQFLNKYPLAGYLILGSNGELVNLSESEKQAVYEASRVAIPPGKLFLAGAGAQSTFETNNLVKLASRAGADAALILNPSYYKGLMNTEALVQHYHEVADASEIPIIIYNMPANSGLDMEADVILKIAQHENIIGLKDSGGNLGKMGQIIHHAPKGFQVLAGSAGFLVPALSIGAIGGILALANIAPQLCLDIYHCFQSGNIQKAGEIQRNVIELNGAVTRKWGVPALKAAMDHLNLYGGPCRKPIQELEPAKLNQLISLMDQAVQ